MRLSEWRARAPHKDALSPKVNGVIEPVLTAMGADPDPACWIAWGDDPSNRFTMLVPTPAGLLQVLVRVNVPQEGPRAQAKLNRWNRVQVGELAIEMASGHRLLSFQVEGQVLRGSDRDADGIAAFALQLFAAIDGRVFVPTKARKPVGGKGKAGPAAKGKAGPAAKPAPAARAPRAPTPRLPVPRLPAPGEPRS